jgi:hypothetical protein
MNIRSEIFAPDVHSSILDGGRANRVRCRLGSREALKKEEFPGFMVHMQPGNSFPQICVVSVIECAETDHVCTIVLKEYASK